MIALKLIFAMLLLSMDNVVCYILGIGLLYLAYRTNKKEMEVKTAADQDRPE